MMGTGEAQVYDRRVHVQVVETGVDAYMYQLQEMEKIALIDRISQREAETARYKINEENKTKRFMAATVVAVVGLVAIVLLACYDVKNAMMCQCVVFIVLVLVCVAVGTNWKDLLSYLKNVWPSETSTRKIE